MSTLTRPAISASVFVTSLALAQSAMANNQVADGEWFELLDYPSKDAFVKAATRYVENGLKQKDAQLYFTDVSAGFDTEGLIGKQEISEETWDMLELEEHEVDMLQAYRELYPPAPDAKIADLVSKAQMNYIGHFYDASDFAVDQIEQLEIDLSAMPALSSCIDYEKLTTQLMVGKKEVSGHYFND
jgi:hypothetical protein